MHFQRVRNWTGGVGEEVGVNVNIDAEMDHGARKGGTGCEGRSAFD